MPRVDNEDFYRSALSAHGETPQGVHWISAHTQEVRFEILRGFLPEDLGELTLVDAGCGFGDLYGYLVRSANPPKRYTGLDVMEPMIETARRRTGCEIHLCDVLNDPLPSADYYLCSGAMNTLTREETRCFIERCFAASGTAFIFNLLKGRDTSSTYNLFLPHEIERLGLELGAEPRMRDGYLSSDFTMAFFKPVSTTLESKESAC